MTLRHFLKQVLRPLPGFGGIFRRREQLWANTRAIAALRAESTAHSGTIESLQAGLAQRDEEIAALRAGVGARADEITALTARTAEQEGRHTAEAASLRAQAETQGGEIASLRAQAETQANAQASEIASLHSRIDAQAGEISAQRERLSAMEASAAQQAAASRLQWKDVAQLEKQGLFVVGHARSGTSVLLQALNSCPDIFLLGEANLHANGLRPRFSSWYNDMHRQFGNTLAKDTFCPATDDSEANGPETFRWLAERFRYVGEKVAFRSETLGYDPGSFFDFHARYFFTSHYVCVIRNPADVLESNNEKFRPESLAIYADSYLRTLQLIVELANTFPNVLMVSHEDITQSTFDTIGRQLGVDLGNAFALYEAPYQKVGRWEPTGVQLPLIDTLIDMHRRVRDAFLPDTLRPSGNRDWKKLVWDVRAARTDAANGLPR